MKTMTEARKIRRLFIDPASKSSGWALFEDKTLLTHGTIAVDPKLPVFERLRDLGNLYFQLPVGRVDEVHIEQLVRNTHIFTHYSVAIIGAALQQGYKDNARTVDADVPISSWQAYTRWHKDKEILKPYIRLVESEDQLAAIGMGLYWVNSHE